MRSTVAFSSPGKSIVTVAIVGADLATKREHRRLHWAAKSIWDQIGCDQRRLWVYSSVVVSRHSLSKKGLLRLAQTALITVYVRLQQSVVLFTDNREQFCATG